MRLAVIRGSRRLSTQPKPTGTGSNKQPEQPKAFTPPPVPPPAESRNLNLLSRFQEKLLRDAETIEEQRKNPEAPTSNFLYRYDAKLDARIKELEAAELKKKVEGKSTKLGPIASRVRSSLSSILDSEKNEAARTSMMNEGFKKGRFDDIKQLAREGDKLWNASNKMTAFSSSPRIPNIAGKSLLGVETDIHTLVKGNRASLVCFLFTALGEPHVKSYVKPFQAAFPDANIVHVNVEEDGYKSWALKLFEPWIRFGVSENLRAQYLVHFGSIVEQRNKIGMANKLVGWVHLVDGEGRVRWSAHGPAKEEELETLIASANALKEEL
ncbi:UNVERIFIED_CONTAM: Mitochondrial ATPase complex subunit atp10 [Siphonaria sp. JEL0065]|nr:Mitochondrial ATPase complex subunit atp10 [Siphonaria sp. JEL0065]